MPSGKVRNLIQQLSHQNWRLRQKAAQDLEKLGVKAKEALQVLYKVVEQDASVLTRISALQAIIRIEDNVSTLIRKLIERLICDESPSVRRKIAESFGTERMLEGIMPIDLGMRNYILSNLRYVVDKNDEKYSVRFNALKAIAQLEEISLVDELVKFLENDNAQKESAARVLASLGRKASNALPKLKSMQAEDDESVRCHVLAAIDQIEERLPIFTFIKYLESKDKSVRASAIVRLGELGRAAKKDEVLKALKNRLFDENEDKENRLKALEALINILEEYESIFVDELIAAIDINLTDIRGRVVLELEALGSTAKKAVQKLKLIQLEDQGADISNDIDRALIAIEFPTESEQIYQVELLKVRKLEEEVDLDKKISIVKTSVKYACSNEPLRFLLRQWIHWIAEGKNALLIETTAEALREQKFAVLPLVSLLGDEAQQEIKAEISMLLEQDVKCQCSKFEKNEALIGQEIDRRVRNINRRIFQLLAEMSDEKFFVRYHDDPDLGKYKQLRLEIKDELTKHALPVLARRFINESNPENREFIILILANLDSYYATHTLATQTHYDRKKLLTDYYLEPSKHQSEQAAQILKSTVDTAKNTLKLQQSLNTVTFVVGLGLLTVALITGMVSKDSAQRNTALLAGIGGLGGMIFHLVNKPLDRIQNSMADLVQAETAFTSYIWELNLNSAFIQSQYMENGVLLNSEVDQTVERVKQVTNLTLERVEEHLEQQEQPSLLELMKKHFFGKFTEAAVEQVGEWSRQGKQSYISKSHVSEATTVSPKA